MKYRVSPKSLRALAVGSVLLTGCASEKPYYALDYRYHQLGLVEVCYSESLTKFDEVKSMADEACNRIERTATYSFSQKYQCSWTAPTLAIFSCTPRPGETPPPLLQKRAPMRHETMPATQ